MSSNYNIENIEYTGTLSRPSTTKGSIFSNGGSSKFELVAPTVNGQVLRSNSSTASGVEWVAVSTTGVGFGLSTRTNTINLPAQGGTNYFLSLSGTTPNTIALPACSWLMFLVTPNRGGAGPNGWSDIPANITGGTLDFYFGYVDPSAANSIANYKYYATGTTTAPGTPDFQISGTSINTAGTTYKAFRHNLSYSVTNGQQISIRLVNNLTSSADPRYNFLQALNLFRTV